MLKDTLPDNNVGKRGGREPRGVPGVFQVDPRGPGRVEEEGDHKGHGGGGEENSALSLGGEEWKSVRGEVQAIHSDA